MPPIKIDLLPKSVKYARVNKALLFAILAALVVGLLALGSMDAKLRGDIAQAKTELEKVTAEANEVKALEAEVATNRSRLKPIADKVQFIEAADECGYVYWERFYSIIEYIYGGGELHFFAILGQPFQPSSATDFDPEALYHLAPAGSTDCAFAVTVKNPNEFARFMLNLMRCPEISDIQVTGSVPSGRVIAAQWPTMLQEWNLPQFQMPTFNFPLAGVTGGGAGGGGAMGGGGMEMGGGAPPMGGPGMGGPGMGGPGMGGPGMGGSMDMGGGPGMGGAGAAAGGGVAQQPRLDAPIEVLITCRLAKSVGIPMPPQGAAAAGAGPAGGMGGPGMGGPGMGGMPGGAGAPPGGGGAPPGAGGSPPGDAGGGADAGGGDSGGGDSGGGADSGGGGGGGEE